jgi:hypothetical protein
MIPAPAPPLMGTCMADDNPYHSHLRHCMSACADQHVNLLATTQLHQLWVQTSSYCDSSLLHQYWTRTGRLDANLPATDPCVERPPYLSLAALHNVHHPACTASPITSQGLPYNPLLTQHISLASPALLTPSTSSTGRSPRLLPSTTILPPTHPSQHPLKGPPPSTAPQMPSTSGAGRSPHATPGCSPSSPSTTPP